MLMTRRTKEDEFLHKLAAKLCESQNVRQATTAYVHILEISCDHVGKNFKDGLLSLGQTANIDVKL